jgi:phosphate transport system protein
MGDMAHHVAKITRMRHPETAIPTELIALIKNMGETALAIATKMGQVIATRNVDLALEVERDDDEMDQLHRQLISTLIAPQWSHGVESAIDLTLLGRYYERFADHAVSVSRRVHFLVTGNYS